MKLLRYGPRGQEKPGLLDRDGKIRDLSGAVGDITARRCRRPRSTGCAGSTRRHCRWSPARRGSGRASAACRRSSAIGLNYRLHAAGGRRADPEGADLLHEGDESSICGPNDDVIIPKGSVKTDYEVELGIVIGTTARYVAVQDAPKHIAGYCVVNDVSEREFQIERGGQWTKGKSGDTFCPMGPWLVTADEVADAGKLQVWTEVNGERRQDSNTADLIFGIDHIVSYVSQFMTLMPGDVIPTGTPSGVGDGLQAAAIPARRATRCACRSRGSASRTQRLVPFRGLNASAVSAPPGERRRPTPNYWTAFLREEARRDSSCRR